MRIDQVLLVFAIVRTGVALLAVGYAPRGSRPWAAPFQGISEICCALLLRLYLDPGYQAHLGGWAWIVFAYALVWNFGVWLRELWGLAGEEDGPPPPSVLGTFGVAVEDGLGRIAGIAWHVMFVAPALVCGAFVLFGLVNELPPLRQ